MDSTPTDEPPHSNEEWFNQESSMILSEQIEQVKLQMKNMEVQDTSKEEIKETEILPSTNTEPSNEDNAKDTNNTNNESEVITTVDFSPDELESRTIQVNPSGCEMTSPDFNDDQDVEIINAFKEGKLVY